MSPSSADMRRARAAAEAAEWTTRFDSGHLSTSERSEFMDWLRESPIHVSEMLQIGRLTSDLRKFNDWGRIVPSGDVSLETVTRLTDYRAVQAPKRHERTHRVRWLAAIAASLTCVAVFLTVFKQQLWTTDIHTQKDERREITLADGSIVQLSPNTDLRIRLQSHIRSVVMQHGEATFRVAKDPLRPFIVDAASVKVQAVGTMFSVARNAEAVVVTVAEGRVSVTPAATAADASRDGAAVGLSLKANERVIVSARGIASPIRHLESVPILDWGDNRLVFEASSVADVVRQFNRRNTVQIRVIGNALALRTVTGIFDASDPQSFVDFLQSFAGATSNRNGEEILVTQGVTGAGPVVPVR
jgi:transmembrane sensor